MSDFKVIKGPSLKKVEMDCDECLHERLLNFPILPTKSFIWLISGGPGSGKTSLILNLLKRSKLYKGLFDKIYWFSPSIHTVDEEIDIPEDQIIPGFDQDKLEEIAEEPFERKLVILDDLVSDIKKPKNLEFLRPLLFNMRHKGLFFIITTQKYNNIPLTLRTVITDLSWFRTNNKTEFESVQKEQNELPKDTFKKIAEFAWSKPHSFLHMRLSDKGRLFGQNFNQIEI